MIWLIGANGMLGTEVSRQLSESKIDFVGTDRNVDITDFASLESFAAGKKITAIVNCAAYTAVDNAESDFEMAKKLNADGPRNIARLAKKIGAILIHISTDYVFDGSATSPISEETPIKPLGVYGQTKADGEKAIQEELDDTEDFYILRTAWLYGFNGKNFVYTMIRAMNARESVKVVSDQRGTPTNCVTLAGLILKIIQNPKDVPGGIYHVTDEGETTWFDFTNEIKKQAVQKGILTNEKCVVNPCETKDYPTPAKRPAYSVLSKKKIQKTLGITLPTWEDSLSNFINSPLFDKARIQ